MTSPPSARRRDDLAGRLCSGAVAGLFETDTGHADDWALAAALCARCPVLDACREELSRAFPGWGTGRRRANPAAVVWAGAIFSPERRLWTRHGLSRATAARTARVRRRQTFTEPAHHPEPAHDPEPMVASPNSAALGRSR